MKPDWDPARIARWLDALALFHLGFSWGGVTSLAMCYATLDRVLKTANRQVGAGDLFGLMGRGLEALMIALNNGSPHLMPVSRSTARSADKAD